MAHGYLQSFDASLQVYSAGTFAANSVNPITIQVTKEIGIDISNHAPCHAYKLINEEWDYLITVCDNAKKECDRYFHKAKHRIHIGFEDPYAAVGSPEYVHSVYVKVRDEIIEAFQKLHLLQLNQKPDCLARLFDNLYGYVLTYSACGNLTTNDTCPPMYCHVDL